MPFMFVSPQRIRWLFMLKAVIVPPAWIAMLIWAFVKVPSNKALLDQRSALSGSALSYAWLRAMNSALGIYATVAVNIPDFTVWRHAAILWTMLMYLTALREARTGVSLEFALAVPCG